MIGLPSETRVWLASGATDMRRGFDGLALLVQETLKRDLHCEHAAPTEMPDLVETSIYWCCGGKLCKNLGLETYCSGPFAG